MVAEQKEMEDIEKMRWRLPIPPRFMPYLQKHRIYDMFYELAVELVINRPNDQVQFLKHALAGAAMSKDKPRVIILAPSFFGTEKLAMQLATAAGVPYVPVTERCYDYIECQGCESSRKPGESLPDFVSRVLRTEPLLSGGWVVAAYPHTSGEADIMRRNGVRPTHVLQLVPSITEDDTCLFSNGCKFTSVEVAAYNEYMRRIRGLRESFASALIEIDIRCRSLCELTNACLTAVRSMPSRALPGPYRVVLLGPTGAGCRTQARLLAKRFKLVLVDAGVEEVRSRLGECPNDQVEAPGALPKFADRVEIVKRRVMEPDCLRHGWVLLGCPRNVGEMRALDRLDTPPNRVIVLDVPVSECRQRLVLRRFNKYTGKEYHLDTGPAPAFRDRNNLNIHPDDSPMRVDRRLREYSTTLPSMLSYLGSTALVVHAGCLPVERTFELTSSAVLRHPPAAPARRPDDRLPPTPAPPIAAAASVVSAAAAAPCEAARRPDLTVTQAVCSGMLPPGRRLVHPDDPCLHEPLVRRRASPLHQSDRPCGRKLPWGAARPDTVCPKRVPDTVSEPKAGKRPAP